MAYRGSLEENVTAGKFTSAEIYEYAPACLVETESGPPVLSNFRAIESIWTLEILRLYRDHQTHRTREIFYDLDL